MDERLVEVLQNIDRHIAAIADALDVMNDQIFVLGLASGIKKMQPDKVPCLTLVKEPEVSQ